MPRSPNSTRARKKTRNSKSCPLSFLEKGQTTELRPENLAMQIMGLLPTVPPSKSRRNTFPVAMAALRPTVRNYPAEVLLKECPVIQVLFLQLEIATLDVPRRDAHTSNHRVAQRGHNRMIPALSVTNPRLLPRKGPIPHTAREKMPGACSGGTRNLNPRLQQRRWYVLLRMAGVS